MKFLKSPSLRKDMAEFICPIRKSLKLMLKTKSLWRILLSSRRQILTNYPNSLPRYLVNLFSSLPDRMKKAEMKICKLKCKAMSRVWLRQAWNHRWVECQQEPMWPKQGMLGFETNVLTVLESTGKILGSRNCQILQTSLPLLRKLCPKLKWKTKKVHFYRQ